ncbi:MAG: Asp-tRNA(Asn)/Glu-tRNA(Gln) amidotransferase subunit GatC [Rhodospirillales bacterium]|nr:Asp-tRNA(Asn)/Glu-tRNA(Gln) amidotransferase subunit GatC [Rhodospirillales bacterium]
MSLDTQTVRTISLLARLRVPEEELEPLAGELSAILDWIEQLAEVDTTGVEPMTSVIALTPPLRADVITDGDCRADVLKNAPGGIDDYYAVPKVVE